MSQSPFKPNVTDILDDDEMDSSSLLLDRIDSWQHAIAVVLDFAKHRFAAQQATTQQLGKQRKIADNVPQFSGASVQGGSEALSSRSGGDIAKAFLALAQNTDVLFAESDNVAHSIKQDIIPTLEQLQHDLKERGKSVSHQSSKGLKEVEKHRESTYKQLEHYNKTLAVINPKGKPDPRIDPYVLHCKVRSVSALQIEQENDFAEKSLQVQHNFRAMEQHIIEVLQKSVNDLNGLARQFYQKGAQTSTSVDRAFGNITPAREWSDFTKGNSHILIPETAYKRDPTKVVFANSGHESSVPLMEGDLTRKGTVFKGHAKPGYFVLTRAGFLHQFKSNDYIEDPTPELSLYIPESELGGLQHSANSDLSFKIASRDYKKAIPSRHRYTFTASSYDELVAWFQALSKVAGASGANIDAMEDASDSASGTTAANTSGIAGAPASPGTPTTRASKPAASTTGASATGASPLEAAAASGVPGAYATTTSTTTRNVGGSPLPAGTTAAAPERIINQEYHSSGDLSKGEPVVEQRITTGLVGAPPQFYSAQKEQEQQKVSALPSQGAGYGKSSSGLGAGLGRGAGLGAGAGAGAADFGGFESSSSANPSAGLSSGGENIGTGLRDTTSKNVPGLQGSDQFSSGAQNYAGKYSSALPGNADQYASKSPVGSQTGTSQFSSGLNRPASQYDPGLYFDDSNRSSYTAPSGFQSKDFGSFYDGSRSSRTAGAETGATGAAVGDATATSDLGSAGAAVPESAEGYGSTITGPGYQELVSGTGKPSIGTDFNTPTTEPSTTADAQHIPSVGASRDLPSTYGTPNPDYGSSGAAFGTGAAVGSGLGGVAGYGAASGQDYGRGADVSNKLSGLGLDDTSAGAGSYGANPVSSGTYGAEKATPYTGSNVQSSSATAATIAPLSRESSFLASDSISKSSPSSSSARGGSIATGSLSRQRSARVPRYNISPSRVNSARSPDHHLSPSKANTLYSDHVDGLGEGGSFGGIPVEKPAASEAQENYEREVEQGRIDEQGRYHSKRTVDGVAEHGHRHNVAEGLPLAHDTGDKLGYTNPDISKPYDSIPFAVAPEPEQPKPEPADETFVYVEKPKGSDTLPDELRPAGTIPSFSGVAPTGAETEPVAKEPIAEESVLPEPVAYADTPSSFEPLSKEPELGPIQESELEPVKETGYSETNLAEPGYIERRTVTTTTYVPPEPVPEPVPEPIAEPVPEPAPEPVAEPIAEPVPEPVPEPAPAPKSFADKIEPKDVEYSTPKASEVPEIASAQKNPLLGSTTTYNKPSFADKIEPKDVQYSTPKAGDVPEIASAQKNPLLGSTATYEKPSFADKIAPKDVQYSTPQAGDVPDIASAEKNPLLGSTTTYEKPSFADKIEPKDVQYSTPQAGNVPDIASAEKNPLLGSTTTYEKPSFADKIEPKDVQYSTPQAGDVPEIASAQKNPLLGSTTTYKKPSFADSIEPKDAKYSTPQAGNVPEIASAQKNPLLGSTTTYEKPGFANSIRPKDVQYSTPQEGNVPEIASAQKNPLLGSTTAYGQTPKPTEDTVSTPKSPIVEHKDATTLEASGAPETPVTTVYQKTTTTTTTTTYPSDAAEATHLSSPGSASLPSGGHKHTHSFEQVSRDTSSPLDPLSQKYQSLTGGSTSTKAPESFNSQGLSGSPSALGAAGVGSAAGTSGASNQPWVHEVGKLDPARYGHGGGKYSARDYTSSHKFDHTNFGKAEHNLKKQL